jgi:predicted outer membrane repeat protein
VSRNTASFGGGIYNDGGTVNLSFSTVSENTADFDGGGIYNDGGTVTLDSSTVSGNIPDDCVNVPGC